MKPASKNLIITLGVFLATALPLAATLLALSWNGTDRVKSDDLELFRILAGKPKSAAVLTRQDHSSGFLDDRRLYSVQEGKKTDGGYFSVSDIGTIAGTLSLAVRFDPEGFPVVVVASPVSSAKVLGIDDVFIKKISQTKDLETMITSENRESGDFPDLMTSGAQARRVIIGTIMDFSQTISAIEGEGRK